MKRGAIFYIHSVAGLLSGLFILLLSVSGAMLVFHEELDHLQYPSVKASPFKMITVDSGYRAIQQQYPHAQISNCSIAGHISEPFVFTIYDSSYKNGSTAMQVFLHPQTSKVLKTRGGSEDMNNNLMSWVSSFHNSFRMHKKGEWLLGLFAIVFLISIITGLILFRKNIVAVLLLRKRVFKIGNLHQIIGVWALLFNLMIAGTGFWMQRYVFKKEFYAADSYTPVLKTSPPSFFKFDLAYSEVKKQYPDFTASVIYFAQSNAGKTALYGSRSSNAFIHSKKFADVIFLDSAGNISKTRFVNEIDAADRYDIINSQLHMGKFGGLGIKIIYFVFGMAGAFLSITGFLLWLRRRPSIS